MDRRQRKTREAIFKAFANLLEHKKFSSITVGEIIQKADVGRATFYAHFETKEYLLNELCRELFCHISDAFEGHKDRHRHIFDCNEEGSVFLHLLSHLGKNDYNISVLFTCDNDGIFSGCFKKELYGLVKKHMDADNATLSGNVPVDLWLGHICSTFTETAKWWFEHGMKESEEEIYNYFMSLSGIDDRT